MGLTSAQVVPETPSTTNSPALYVYGLERISRREPFTPRTHYYVYDGHGSVRALTDANGAVTDTYDYDAFGNLIRRTGTTPNVYLFAGEQFDPDLGLYYNRARYLNVSTGRFWTMDAHEGENDQPTSLHKYTYAQADPVDIVDPSGKFGIDELSAALEIVSTLANLASVHTQNLLGLPTYQILLEQVIKSPSRASIRNLG